MLMDRHQKAHETVGRPGLPYTILADSTGIVHFINTGFPENTAHEIIEKLEQTIKNLVDSRAGNSL